MKAMIGTFAHGNGPYSRILDLGVAINKELRRWGIEPMPIVFPLVYGERQKRIMFENHGRFIEENPGLVLLDETYGRLLSELFFKSGHFRENLEYVLQHQPEIEERLTNHLASTLVTRTFDGKEVCVRCGDVKFEVSCYPRVATGYVTSFAIPPAFSGPLEAAERASLEGLLDFDPALLREVRVKIAERVEKDKTVHLIPDPFVFERRKRGDEIFVPPLLPPPQPNTETVPEGMYVTVSGVDGLKNLFDGVRAFGLKLYCSPSANIENADNTHPPEFVSNPNIKYHFGRLGWSTIWLSHMTETPLITPAYTPGDEPEVYFSQQRAIKLGLAVVFDASKDPNDVLKDADALRSNLRKVNLRLRERYGTLNGIDYAAKVIVESVFHHDVSRFRQVQPVFGE